LVFQTVTRDGLSIQEPLWIAGERVCEGFGSLP
jgi:hypothetical protein